MGGITNWFHYILFTDKFHSHVYTPNTYLPIICKNKLLTYNTTGTYV